MSNYLLVFVTSNTYNPKRSNDTSSLSTTITNNQLLPDISIDDISEKEENDNNQELIFTVSLSQENKKTITMDYATS